ncbi:MKI67 FHA domain-interacting nucleolar phosphoprotein [Latimeria chalumnae]|uniref:MKI67 FHA domain-interacting nucleolar phosphoprotein n=1 Tax=Latimeria chalumnae TaxID=7897 RepID=UPI0006D8F00D|nr:PREDICTED: MKI67 FHA domain-interacting nucleolar phosphoprotein [Latimeria chalumnae]|eukprot:XP_014348738.1 PREDICTED: MKI67 FHA domain-interacting nucleolar phosphoprotein [Latimeria chalumnae]
MSENPSPAAEGLLSLDPKLQKEFQHKIRGIGKRPGEPQKLTPGVIYLGHVPHGFFEPQIRSYFSQFGKVTRLRLSRSKKTGRSKGYAFVEFECDEVAKIVADTMNNYLFCEKLLKCQFMSPEKVHSQLFTGSQTPFRKPCNPAVARYNKKRTPQEKRKMVGKLVEKETRLRKRLAEAGVEYNFPGFAAQAPKRKKWTEESVTVLNMSVNSQDPTPFCSPEVIERRKSLKVEEDNNDDEITFKLPPAKMNTKQKTRKQTAKSQKAGKSKKTKGKI